MAKVTSKLQLTIPKRLADAYGIRPGDEVGLEPSGATIRLVPPSAKVAARTLSQAERLRLFDEDVAWQREREQHMKYIPTDGGDRGWTRDELYDRDLPD